MKVDGNKIAEKILFELQQEIARLKKERKITPHLAILLVGKNPASLSYVRKKVEKAEQIGARATVYKFDENVSKKEIEKIIERLNDDNHTHGIIIQRPLPQQIDEDFARKIVAPKKDVDGFLNDSKFDEPIAEAVLEILKVIHSDICLGQSQEEGRGCTPFMDWLEMKNIVVVGKGDTGGRPIINLFKKIGIQPVVIDSKTEKPGELVKRGDVIISTVGRHRIIPFDEIKEGAIVFGIGMHKGEDSRLYPDYNEKEVAKRASYYTPVP